MMRATEGRRRTTVGERWTLSPASILGVVLVVAAGLILRSEPLPTSESGGAQNSPSPVTEPSRQATAPSALPPSLVGRSWHAEIGEGIWIAGTIGGETTSVPEGDIPIASGNGWLLAMVQGRADEDASIRSIGEGTRRGLETGLEPPVAVISGNQAFVSGLSRSSTGDPGLVVVDLATGTTATLLPPSGSAVFRTVAVSRSGKTVVSAVCPDTAAVCDLDVVSVADGATRHLPTVPGYLRATGDSLVIVGEDPATQITAVDIQTGRELWSQAADEYWLGYVTSADVLVQASLAYNQGKPEFVVQAIARDGSARELFRTAAARPLGLWPDISSDDVFTVGPGFSTDDALLQSRGGRVEADALSLEDGSFVATVPVGVEG